MTGLLGVALAFACGDDGGSSTTGTDGGTDSETETAGTSAGTGGGTTSGGATDSGTAGATDSASSTSAGTTGGASTGGTTGGVDDCDCAGDACPPECIEPLEPEVGFHCLEPISYSFHSGASQLDLDASEGCLWTGFIPATQDPENKPILLLFNGGPGAASEVLFGFNTVNKSLDEDNNGGMTVGSSPAPWTDFANVLYIDARTTGFSYNLMDDPGDQAKRNAEFGVHNFNVWLDAGDFVRVLLRWLKDHPVIRGNDVVLVGESYGGVRATAMLDLLLAYESHGDGTHAYEDGALVDEIQSHLDVVFPAMAGQSFGPADVAQQFVGQVLVQPLLLGDQQLAVTGDMHDAPGSVIFDIAQDTGTTFVPCSQQGGGCNKFSNAINFVEGTANRDRFAYAYPYNWLFDRIDSLGPKLSTVATATEFFETDITAVDGLYASNRDRAYRTPGVAPYVKPTLLDLAVGADPRWLEPGWSLTGKPKPQPQNGDYPATFGDLAFYDTYYMPSNYLVLDYFYSSTAYNYGTDPYADILAEAFLRNTAYVKTFITNAAYDLVIWAPSIPETLKQFGGFVTQVTHDTVGPAGADRPGQFIIDYQNGVFGLGAGESRTVRMPFYSVSSHTVTLNEPAGIAADVEEWLTQ